jgi:hypothetical protein
MFIVAVRFKKGIFIPAFIEYDNPATCFIANGDFCTVFKNFEDANKFKNKILKMKREKLLTGDYSRVKYATVMEFKEVEYACKN